MHAEISTLSRSSQKTKTSSVEKMSILVVDDDSTCLAIVAAILKACKYEVVTVKHAIDALCTLRIKRGSFDLVVTDVHMPDMNGFELQKQINEEFNLPVVLMSADDKEAVTLHGLESGAVFFLVKPVSRDDLKNLWQYAFAKKRGKTVIGKSVSVRRISLADHHNETSNEDVDYASSVKEESRDKKDPMKKVLRVSRDDKGDENDDSTTPKKAKVVWTNTLHNQFLEAIRTIGLERAVPKKILEIMNVPGLTRENVASHLQQHVRKEALNSELDIDGYKSDNYCPWLDPNPKQLQGFGELVNPEDLGKYQYNNTTMWNHISPSQLDDEIFIHSMLSSDAFGGNDSLGLEDSSLRHGMPCLPNF